MMKLGEIQAGKTWAQAYGIEEGDLISVPTDLGRRALKAAEEKHG